MNCRVSRLGRTRERESDRVEDHREFLTPLSLEKRDVVDNLDEEDGAAFPGRGPRGGGLSCAIDFACIPGSARVCSRASVRACADDCFTLGVPRYQRTHAMATRGEPALTCSRKLALGVHGVSTLSYLYSIPSSIAFCATVSNRVCSI